MADKEKTELKPCPCCGGEADVHTDDSIGISITYFVYCIKCDMATNSMTHRVDVVKIWNNRKDSTAHEQALLLKLEGMYQTVRGLKKELAETKKALAEGCPQTRKMCRCGLYYHKPEEEMCVVCEIRHLEKEVLRVKLRNSELKELLYAADAIIGEERLASAKITWISTAVVELKKAQEDTDKKAEEDAGNG